jgi:hypothetical protein
MKKFLVTALAVSCVASIANADVTPSTATGTPPAASAPSDTIKTSESAPSSPKDNISQTTSGPSSYDSLKKVLEVTYFGDYRGGSAGQYGTGVQPTVGGNPDDTSPQGIENFITTGYKFAPNWMVGVTTHFFYNTQDSVGPALPSGNNQNINSGMEMLNPMFVLTKTKLIDNGNFKLKGYLYAQVPLSQYDYISVPGRDMATAIQPTANMTYDIPGTRWTLGTYSYITGYIPTSSTPSGLRTYKFYAAPYVNYQMTATVAATLWVDLLQITRAQGTPFIDGMSNYTADVEPGINWDVIPGALSLNPMLNIYPGHATLASTSFQMVVVGKAF